MKKNEVMELRDVFAASALQGFIVAYYSPDRVGPPPVAHAARIAYAYAEAMLEERDCVAAKAVMEEVEALARAQDALEQDRREIAERRADEDAACVGSD